MRKSVAGLMAGVVVAGGIAFAVLRPTPEGDLRAACIAALRGMLDQPSTLRVIGDDGMVVRPATQIEFMGWEDPARQEREMVMANSGTDRQAELVRMQLELFGSGGWQVAQMILDYEAAPPPGLPWRRLSICKAVGKAEGFPAGVRAAQVRIDGDTMMDRAVSRAVGG